MDFLFKVGQIYSGFQLVDISPVPDYESVGYLFKHLKTDMEVYFLSNKDEECFFSYNVYTPPFDNSGVFHILEHTLLTGSKKYPVRDPFMAMSRNSCNTFLNAMTGPDRTYYPAASPLKKDFDNIFSVYTDAIFSPLLRKESFMQEGIRIIKKRGSLEAEGVVFSEMKGDVYEHGSVVQNTANRFLFDDNSPFRFESGGEPEEIITLSYERFVETYKKFYVPNNITLFLYGDVDILEKLRFLDDEYLKNRTKGEEIKRSAVQERSTLEQIRVESDAEDGEEMATVMLSWLMKDASDPLLNTLLSLIVDVLMGNPGCPLYKAIIDSSLSRDISPESGMTDSFRNLTFMVGLSGAKEKNSIVIQDMILSSLRNIVETGLDKELVEASLRRMEFRLQEIKEGLPEGYRIFFSRIDKGWAYGRNPSYMLSIRKQIATIRSTLEKKERYLENWINENLIENHNRLLSIIVMDKNCAPQREERLKKVIEEKANYSNEDEKLYKKYERERDSLESLSKLPHLSLNDLPNKLCTIERREEDGVLVTPMKTNGIVYADIAFDVSDFTYEELEYVSLLSRLMTMTNVGKSTYSEFLTKLKLSTGAFSSSFDSGTTCSEKERDFLIIRFKSLEEYYSDSLNLILDLINEGDFSSKERIDATLRDIQSDFEASVIRQGHLFALTSSTRGLSSALYSAEKTQGIEFWIRVSNLLKEDSEAIGERLLSIAKRVFSKNRAIFHLCLSPTKLDEFVSLSKSFLDRIKGSEKCAINRHRIPLEASTNIAYTFATPVSYIAFSSSAPISKRSLYSSSSRMLLSIVSESKLWALEREKGGAYGTGSALDITENVIYFYTYRDPRLDKSIDDFFLAVEKEEIDDEKINNAKLKVLARDLRPTGPQSKAFVDLRRFLYEITDTMRREIKEDLLRVTKEDLLEAKSSVLSQMKKDGRITVITNQKALKATKNKFKIIPLPFGAT